MDSIVTINDRHAIIMFNPAAGQISGYAASEIVRGPLSRLLPQRLHAAHGQQMKDFSARGEEACGMGSLGWVAACRADGAEFAAEGSVSHFTVGAKLYTQPCSAT
ncbi:MAG: PAS domain S-box protein [Pseudomonadota bacterium]|nr:PAS domain S-box protein [Pseudomonadota bacterium]